MARADENLALSFMLEPAMVAFVEDFRVELQSRYEISDEEARGRLIKVIMRAFLQIS